MDGTKLKGCHTLGSMYDMNSVAVNNGTSYMYRIKATELQKLLKYFKFEEEPSRKYTYLVNPKLKGGKHG